LTPSATDRLLQLAGTRKVLRGADARELGVSPQLLVKLHNMGRLQRVARGVYSLPGTPITQHQALIEVCKRVPKAVICLLSALELHQVGTQSPHEVWIALPESSRTPAVSYPTLRVVRLCGDAYREGTEVVIDEGAEIRVYSLAKTIADCFKFRNKVGLDVALEALKDAWRHRLVSVDELIHFASIDRVERVMRPYLEALVA
jgi:predicted transcriptional regulator of viral defense system